VAAPIEPIDQGVRHYAGQLGEIKDGLEVAFALPCGTCTL
jgi:hypothetical protein